MREDQFGTADQPDTSVWPDPGEPNASNDALTLAFHHWPAMWRKPMAVRTIFERLLPYYLDCEANVGRELMKRVLNNFPHADAGSSFMVAVLAGDLAAWGYQRGMESARRDLP